MPQILTQLGGMFDLFDCNALALYQHAYEDVLYRYALSLLYPNVLNKHPQVSAGNIRRPARYSVSHTPCNKLLVQAGWMF